MQLWWLGFPSACFCSPPFRRAKQLLIGMIGGWLFLPVASVKLKAIPEFGKLTAASYACLLGTFLFDFARILRFRLRFFDLPVLVYCLVPFFTSLENDLGWYEGISACIVNSAIWGIPYLLGRMYFTDWESFRDLGMAIFIGGLIYVPLCWIEIRFSPQLHRIVYGFNVGAFGQSKRMGGFRPLVFLNHGLTVGMWMTSASLVGVWMWQCKTIKSLWGMPMYVLVPVLLVTTVFCKSMAGLGFLVMGLASLYSIKWTRWPILLLLVMCISPTYMYLRGSATWTGETAVKGAAAIFGADRAQSLNTRIVSENILCAHALEQPWFGWGRFNRNRVYDRDGKDLATTDGMWVIVLGVNGIVGLLAITAAMLLPPLIIWRRCPPRLWSHPGVAPAAAMAVLLALYMLDNVLNAMPDPIFVLAMGGLTGIGPSIRAATQPRDGASGADGVRSRSAVDADWRQSRPARAGHDLQPLTIRDQMRPRRTRMNTNECKN